MSTIHPKALPAKARGAVYRQSNPTATIAESNADHVEKVYPTPTERTRFDDVEIRALEATHGYVSSLKLRYRQSDIAAMRNILLPERRGKTSFDRLALAELGDFVHLLLLPDILIVYDSMGKANLQPRQITEFLRKAPQVIFNQPKEPFATPEEELRYKASQFLASFAIRETGGALELKQLLAQRGDTIQVGQEEIPRAVFEHVLAQRLDMMMGWFRK